MSDKIDIPQTFESAVQSIIDLTSVDNVDMILDAKSADDICIQMHDGLGRWIRNNWELWSKTNRMCQWFKKEHGITHPDDMSSLLLGEAVARMRQEVFDFYGTVKRFHQHWAQFENALNKTDNNNNQKEN